MDDVVMCRSTSINSITADGQELLLEQPVFIVLEEDGEEVAARMPELEAVGFGLTEPEAIHELKSELGALYEDLVISPDEELGRLPLSWKRILDNLVASSVEP